MSVTKNPFAWNSKEVVKGKLVKVDKGLAEFTRRVRTPELLNGDLLYEWSYYTHGISADFSDDDYEELSEDLGYDLEFILKDGKLKDFNRRT